MSIQNNNSNSGNKRNTLSLNSQVYQQLLKKLNSVPNTTNANPNRKFTRLEYCDPFLDLVINSADNMQRRKVTVATRNISRGGMSILHSSFVYNNTTISTKLFRTDGSSMDISGKVCRCEHRGGIVHEIGIEFDTQIVVQEFIRANILESISSLESLDPTQLEGTALFIGNDRNVIPFVRQFLLTTNLNFKIIATAAEALDFDYREQDIIFICLDAGDMTGSELTRHLRDSGYRRPIILSGKGKCDSIKEQITISNADMFLETPFTEPQLLCALGEFMLFQWSDQQLDDFRKLNSTDTLCNLESELLGLGKQLTTKLEANDPVQVYITCTEIRNYSSRLGLKALYDLTKTVSDEIAQSGDMTPHMDDLKQIMTHCSSLDHAA